MKVSMDLLQNALNEIEQLYSDFPLLLASDFTARLGTLSLIQEKLVTNTNLYATREVSDMVINTRGRKLENAMSESSIILINGSKSDRLSKYTCFHVSRNIINFAWASLSVLSLIYDLEIVQIENALDHFPLHLQLLHVDLPDATSTYASIQTRSKETVRWARKGEEKFRNHMRWSDKVLIINNKSLDEKNENLIAKIK